MVQYLWYTGVQCHAFCVTCLLVEVFGWGRRGWGRCSSPLPAPSSSKRPPVVDAQSRLRGEVHTFSRVRLECEQLEVSDAMKGNGWGVRSLSHRAAEEGQGAVMRLVCTPI